LDKTFNDIDQNKEPTSDIKKKEELKEWKNK